MHVFGYFCFLSPFSALHLENSRPLFVAAMHLVDIVIPQVMLLRYRRLISISIARGDDDIFSTCLHPLQEDSISLEEKVDISRRICQSLFCKILADIRHTLSDEESDVIHRLDAR